MLVCECMSPACRWRSGSDGAVAHTVVLGRFARLACLCLVLGSYCRWFVCASAGCSVCAFDTCGVQISRLPRDAWPPKAVAGVVGAQHWHTETYIQKRTCKKDGHVGMGLPLWHSDSAGPVRLASTFGWRMAHKNEH